MHAAPDSALREALLLKFRMRMEEASKRRRRPLTLHAKVTLSLLALVLLIFGVLFWIYLSATRTLIVEENRRRAELLAAQLAQHLSSEQVANNLALLRNDAFYYQRAHAEIAEIRIYGVTSSGVREVVAVPVGVAGHSPPPLLPLDLLSEAQQGRVASRIEEAKGRSYRISAGAPIENEGRLIGFVLVRAEMAYYRSLLDRLNRLTGFALLIAVGGITAALHLLFRRWIYRPIAELLSVMRRAEQGELHVRASVNSPDEMGALSVGLNALLSRIREMTEALEAEQGRLEVLVREATAELSERNRQLQQANRQLFALQRQLLQMERWAAAGQLAAQFAHEIGTPLNLISGHIQLLRARVSDEEWTRRLDIILGQIERIERIVRHVLDSTRRPRPERVPLRVGLLLEHVAEIVAPTLKDRQIELLMELAPDLPEILGSPEQLQQVLINLIDNSLDAMPEGGRLTLRAFAGESGTVILECEDTGVGMSADVLGCIFEPFFTTKPDGAGSGLGLAIVRQIIKEHGGEITVRSEPGRGTTVRLTFPAAPHSASEERA